MPPLRVSDAMATRTWNELDEISQRGRVFSQSFPGTAASDLWRSEFASTHRFENEHRDKEAEPSTAARLTKP